ncbi:MAG: Spy/CpxP family protein refolding chaperone [Burkholderiales bacterium]
MKKINKMYALALASLMALALVVPFAGAQSGNDQGNQPKQRGERRAHGGRHGRGEFGMFSRLNLTDAQKAQMKQIGQSSRERTNPLRQELHAKMRDLRQAEQGGAFNEALVTRKLTETAPLRAKLMGEEFKTRQEMLAVLTPEQKTQFDQMREQFKSRRGQGRSPKAVQKSSQ